jgi:hypothetical protein
MWDCKECGTKGILGGEFGLKFCPTCHSPRPDTVPAKPARVPAKAKQQEKEGTSGAEDNDG